MRRTTAKILKAAPGTFLSVTIRHPIKTRQSIKKNIFKIVKLVARGGVEYDRIKAVVRGRQIGTKPAKNQGLPWGRWEKYPLTLKYLGKRYVRLSLVPGNRAKVEYRLNNKKVNFGQIKSFVLSGEHPHKKMGEVITVQENNIIKIK